MLTFHKISASESLQLLQPYGYQDFNWSSPQQSYRKFRGVIQSDWSIWCAANSLSSRSYYRFGGYLQFFPSPPRSVSLLLHSTRSTLGYPQWLTVRENNNRALLYSMRESAHWITKSLLDSKFLKFVHRVCNPVFQNIRFGLSSPPWLKNLFKVVRYEDLALNTVNTTQELFRFAGFNWSESVEQWIAQHSRRSSKTSARDPYSLPPSLPLQKCVICH